MRMSHIGCKPDDKNGERHWGLFAIAITKYILRSKGNFIVLLYIQLYFGS